MKFQDFNNKILDMLNVNKNDFDEDYDEDEDFEDDEIENDEDVHMSRRERKAAKREARRSFQEDDEYEENIRERQQAPRYRSESSYRTAPTPSIQRNSNNKVVSINNSTTELEVYTYKPLDSNSSSKACDILKEGKPVIINIEAIDPMEAQRIIDIICGCIYAISGNMCKISNYIYLFTPGSIDITGDYIELNTNGDKNFLTVDNEY